MPVPTYPDLPVVSAWHFLFENASVDPNTVIYVDPERKKEIRYGQLKTITKRMAYTLRHTLELGPGSTVLLFSNNCVLFPVFVLATQAANIICSPANAAFHTKELSYQMRDSNCELLVVGPEVLSVALETAALIGFPEDRIFLLSEDPIGNIKSIWQLGTEDASELEPDVPSLHDIRERASILCYSSGTSGLPKGVKTTSFNLTSAVLQLKAADPTCYTGRQVWIGALPLSHIYALSFHAFMAVYVGATVVILPRFSLTGFCETIQSFGVTAAHIVPPIAVSLAKMPYSVHYDLSSVREWRSAAASLGADMVAALEARWGVPLRILYGMTEATCPIALSRSDDPPSSKSALGRWAPHVEGKMVDGELWIRGPNVMSGYHNNPTANEAAFDEERFFRTGDVVNEDDDGFVWFIERAKELIKYKGFQVSPAELEDLLLKHEDVLDAAVVGIDDPEHVTEVPLAFVVLHPAAHASRATLAKPAQDARARELNDWVSNQVAYYKKLRGGILFIDSIPKSPSGKILRRVLRDMAKEKLRPSQTTFQMKPVHESASLKVSPVSVDHRSSAR